MDDNAPIVVVDPGAGSSVDLIGWLEKRYPAAKELGISFLAIGSITANPGSLETVFRWRKALEDNVKSLIVKNIFQSSPGFKVICITCDNLYHKVSKKSCFSRP